MHLGTLSDWVSLSHGFPPNVIFVLTGVNEMAMAGLLISYFVTQYHCTETIHVAKPEWGTKRLCPSCGARFYDMKRNPVSCPSCDADVQVETLPKVKKAAPVKEAAPKEEPKVEPAASEEIPEGDDIDAVLEDDIEDIEDDGDDDTLIEDASDLEEDDDIPEIAEHMEDDINQEG